jgi:hypothetical protein
VQQQQLLRLLLPRPREPAHRLAAVPLPLVAPPVAMTV